MNVISKKLLIAFSIISILLGLFYTVPYILFYVMSRLLGMESDFLSSFSPVIVITGIVQLIAGILSLITIRKTLMSVPALIFIAAGLILSIAQMIPVVGNGIMNTITGILPVALDVFGLVAILKIRKSNGTPDHLEVHDRS